MYIYEFFHPELDRAGMKSIVDSRDAIWGKRVTMEDPVFGRIQSAPVRTKSSIRDWGCVEPSSFGNKLDEVEEVIIYASERGPTDVLAPCRSGHPMLPFDAHRPRM